MHQQKIKRNVHYVSFLSVFICWAFIIARYLFIMMSGVLSCSVISWLWFQSIIKVARKPSAAYFDRDQLSSMSFRMWNFMRKGHVITLSADSPRFFASLINSERTLKGYCKDSCITQLKLHSNKFWICVRLITASKLRETTVLSAWKAFLWILDSLQLSL